MDIERLNQIGSFLDTRLKKKRENEKNRSNKAGKKPFRSVMNKVVDSPASIVTLQGWDSLPELDGSETVESLLDDVYEAGEALKKDPVFGPLNGYKKTVRRFMRYIIENSLKAEEMLGTRNPKTMQQKTYLIVRVVDEKLESLAAHVLKNQIDQFEILRRIDEIHGILIDLMG